MLSTVTCTRSWKGGRGGGEEGKKGERWKVEGGGGGAGRGKIKTKRRRKRGRGRKQERAREGEGEKG